MILPYRLRHTRDLYGRVSMVGFPLQPGGHVFPVDALAVSPLLSECLHALYGQTVPLPEQIEGDHVTFPELVRVLVSGWPDGAHLWAARSFMALTNTEAEEAFEGHSCPISEAMKTLMLRWPELPDGRADSKEALDAWTEVVSRGFGEGYRVDHPLMAWGTLRLASLGLWTRPRDSVRIWINFAEGAYRAISTLGYDPLNAVVSHSVDFGHRAGLGGWARMGEA